MFAGQLLHADVPRMRLYVPAGHAWHASGVPVKPAMHWHAELPLLELVLPGHATHVPFSWYVFPGQAEQVRLKRHCDGALGNCTNCPSVQLRHTVAADSEYRALEQFVQAALPLTFLKDPTAHAEHVAPVYPALQTHCVIDKLPLGEFVLAGHAEHVMLSTPAT